MWLAFYFIRQHCLTHFLVSIILLCYKLDLYHSLLWSSWTGFQYFWNRTASLCSFIMQLKCCSFQLYNSSCKTSLNSLPWFRTPLNLFHHLYPTLHPVPTLNFWPLQPHLTSKISKQSIHFYNLLPFNILFLRLGNALV